MTNDRIITSQDVELSKDLKEALEPLNHDQRQRVIGFAACLRTLAPVSELSAPRAATPGMTMKV